MLTAVVFLVSFAWSSVYVGLPFYIERITRSDPATTVTWTGWILGITSLVSMASSPLWARQAARGDPLRSCVVVQILQAVGFVAAAYAVSLVQLFVVRLALGAVGVTTTLAFVLAGRARDPARRRRELTRIQAANTAGQVLAPLVGGIAAARLGFRLSFVLAALLLAVCGALLQWGVPSEGPTDAAAVTRRRRPPPRLVILTSIVVLVGAAHDGFLAAVLPRVLPGLSVEADASVETAGLLIFASGAAAAVGALAAPGLAAELPMRRLLPLLLAGSSVGVLALLTAPWLWLYAVIRILQALCVAPLFPLAVARMARLGGTEAIGILNAARAGGNFLGPVVATSLLAWGPPGLVYVVLGLAGLAVSPLARW